MKVCEVCGMSGGEIYGKTGKYGMDLCANGSFKIDIDDIDIISKYTWHIDTTRDDPRAISSVRGTTVYAQKVIRNCSGAIVCINKDTLDYRKQNIIPGNNSNAHSNSKKYSNNTSGHKGISWNKYRRKWHSHITVSGKLITLGYFEYLEDAIVARKAAEEKYFGDFAYDPSRDVTLNKTEE